MQYSWVGEDRIGPFFLITWELGSKTVGFNRLEFASWLVTLTGCNVEWFEQLIGAAAVFHFSEIMVQLIKCCTTKPPAELEDSEKKVAFFTPPKQWVPYHPTGSLLLMVSIGRLHHLLVGRICCNFTPNEASEFERAW